jgi:hypothetical protein
MGKIGLNTHQHSKFSFLLQSVRKTFVLSFILLILFSSLCFPAFAAIDFPMPEIGTSSVTINTIDAYGAPLTPTALILYDAAYSEKARGAPILGNSYTFFLLPAGTYIVEAYINDMFVGSASNIAVQAGKSISQTLTVLWSKVSLAITAYCSNGFTPLPNAIVTVYSYNGQSGAYGTVAAGITDSSGQANFLLWPTTLSAEKYKVVITQIIFQVGVNDQVKINKFGTTTLQITTTATALSQSGSIAVTVVDSLGAALTPSVLILFNSSYIEKARGLPLIGNVYTFSSIPVGTYTIEAYSDDMFIGSIDNIIVQNGQTTSKTLQVSLSKQSIVVTAYCKDNSTPLPNAFVTINSWNGQTQQYTPRALGITDSSGKIRFSVWPTTLSNEKYKIIVLQTIITVATQDGVKVAKSGETNLNIKTTADIPIPTPVASINVSFLDRNGLPLIPSVIILYDSSYVELKRVVPLLNYYIFDFQNPGTYSFEGYIDDMLIGSLSNVNILAGPLIAKSIQTMWSKNTLSVNVYCKDGSTPLIDATVSVFSWNGYIKEYTLRGSSASNNAGIASFSLWPTTLTAEKYQVKITYKQSNVGQVENVKVDSNIGGKVSVSTSIEKPSNTGDTNPPIVQPTSFSPTINGYDFANSLPKTVAGYSDVINAMNSPSWASKIPPPITPLIAILAVGWNQKQSGNCFGMTYTAKYYYEHPQALSTKYPGFTNLNEIPQSSAAPEILVNHFPGQIAMQPYFLTFTATRLNLTSLNDQVPWIINECESNRPVLLHLIGHTTKNPTIYHSVLAYSSKPEGSGFLLEIYDPNYKEETCYLLISKDSNGNFIIDRSYYTRDLATLYGLENFGASEYTGVSWNTILEHLNILVKNGWDMLAGTNLSSLGFRVDSPANLLVTAQNGSRVGFDEKTGTIVNDLQGVFYSGPETEPQIIIIPNPETMKYDVSLSGTGNGTYTLTVERYDNGTIAGDPVKTTGEIQTGQLKQYTLKLTENTQPEILESPDNQSNNYIVIVVVAVILLVTAIVVLYGSKLIKRKYGE